MVRRSARRRGEHLDEDDEEAANNAFAVGDHVAAGRPDWDMAYPGWVIEEMGKGFYLVGFFGGDPDEVVHADYIHHLAAYPDGEEGNGTATSSDEATSDKKVAAKAAASSSEDGSYKQSSNEEEDSSDSSDSGVGAHFSRPPRRVVDSDSENSLDSEDGAQSPRPPQEEANADDAEAAAMDVGAVAAAEDQDSEATSFVDSESEDDSSEEDKHCGKCKKSRCLKKYCECFSAGRFCNKGCACIDCLNLPDLEPSEAGRADSMNEDGEGDEITLTENDVLFGKGKRKDHLGNQRFRRLCDSRRDSFQAAGRRGRRAIVAETYEKLTSGGARFLEEEVCWDDRSYEDSDDSSSLASVDVEEESAEEESAEEEMESSSLDDVDDKSPDSLVDLDALQKPCTYEGCKSLDCTWVRGMGFRCKKHARIKCKKCRERWARNDCNGECAYCCWGECDEEGCGNAKHNPPSRYCYKHLKQIRKWVKVQKAKAFKKIRVRFLTSLRENEASKEGPPPSPSAAPSEVDLDEATHSEAEEDDEDASTGGSGSFGGVRDDPFQDNLVEDGKAAAPGDGDSGGSSSSSDSNSESSKATSPVDPETDGESEGDEITPTANDVLIGCGNAIRDHPGNQQFRSLCDSRRDSYQSAGWRGRRAIVAEILAGVAYTGGRFLVKEVCWDDRSYEDSDDSSSFVFDDVEEESAEEEMESAGAEEVVDPQKRVCNFPLHVFWYLMAWMMSPTHIEHPFPTEQEKAELIAETGIEPKQLMRWFEHNRRRYWTPRVEEMRRRAAECGKTLQEIAMQSWNKCTYEGCESLDCIPVQGKGFRCKKHAPLPCESCGERWARKDCNGECAYCCWGECDKEGCGNVKHNGSSRYCKKHMKQVRRKWVDAGKDKAVAKIRTTMKITKAGSEGKNEASKEGPPPSPSAAPSEVDLDEATHSEAEEDDEDASSTGGLGSFDGGGDDPFGDANLGEAAVARAPGGKAAAPGDGDSDGSSSSSDSDSESIEATSPVDSESDGERDDDGNAPAGGVPNGDAVPPDEIVEAPHGNGSNGAVANGASRADSSEDDGANGVAEFGGVDPCMDLELATALCVSMDEDALLQKAEAQGGAGRSSERFDEEEKKDDDEASQRGSSAPPNAEAQVRTPLTNDYEGDCDENGKRHGWGKMLYANGTVYEGQWVAGTAHGDGVCTYATGKVVEGNWVNGKLQGRGKMKHGKRVYDGEWKDGKIHGTGTMAYENGNVYEGQWMDGMRSGTGTFTWASGEVYQGELENGQRHGKGKMTYASLDDGNCNVYDGEWENDKRSGTGTFTWAANGERYEGEWENNMKHGRGVFTHANGNVYEGEWENGTMLPGGRGQQPPNRASTVQGRNAPECSREPHDTPPPGVSSSEPMDVPLDVIPQDLQDCQREGRQAGDPHGVQAEEEAEEVMVSSCLVDLAEFGALYTRLIRVGKKVYFAVRNGGGGNCLFMATSQSECNGDEGQHMGFRNLVADTLANPNCDIDVGQVALDDDPSATLLTPAQYSQRIREPGEYADNIEITALSNALDKPFIVYQDGRAPQVIHRQYSFSDHATAEMGDPIRVFRSGEEKRAHYELMEETLVNNVPAEYRDALGLSAVDNFSDEGIDEDLELQEVLAMSIAGGAAASSGAPTRTTSSEGSGEEGVEEEAKAEEPDEPAAAPLAAPPAVEDMFHSPDLQELKAIRTRIYNAYAALNGCSVEEAAMASELQAYADISSLNIEQGEELRSKADEYDEMVALRCSKVVPLLLECRGLLREPQIDLCEDDAKIVSSLKRTAGHGDSFQYIVAGLFETSDCIGISNSALERLNNRIAKLSDEKEHTADDSQQERQPERGQEVQVDGSQPESPPAAEGQGGSSFESRDPGLAQAADARAQTEEWTRSSSEVGIDEAVIRNLFCEKREMIRDLWDKTHASTAEKAAFVQHCRIEEEHLLTSDLLEQHQRYAAALEAKLEKMQPILDLIEKREGVLELLRKDRPTAATQLMEKEGLECRVTNGLAMITEDLKQRLKQWHAGNKPKGGLEEGDFVESQFLSDYLQTIEGERNVGEETEEVAPGPERLVEGPPAEAAPPTEGAGPSPSSARGSDPSAGGSAPAETSKEATRLEELGKSISALWKMLRIPREEQEAFNAGVGMGLDTIRKGEAELARLEELKSVVIGKLIKQREVIQDLWDKTHASTAEKAAFVEHYSIEAEHLLTLKLLEEHEAYAAALKAKLAKMQPILGLIAEREGIIAERNELESQKESSDQVFGRPATKRLMKEELKKLLEMNCQVTKITEELKQRLKQLHAGNKPKGGSDEGEVVESQFFYEYLQMLLEQRSPSVPKARAAGYTKKSSRGTGSQLRSTSTARSGGGHIPPRSNVQRVRRGPLRDASTRLEHNAKPAPRTPPHAHSKPRKRYHGAKPFHPPGDIGPEPLGNANIRPEHNDARPPGNHRPAPQARSP